MDPRWGQNKRALPAQLGPDQMSTPSNWVREAREAKAGTAPTAAERAEIRELRAELERVTRERDILGKAVAYFSASHPKNV